MHCEKENCLGNRLCSLRQEKGLTQKEVSDRIGITKAMLSKYENGRNIPRADVLADLADVLETSTDYLLCRTGDPSIPRNARSAKPEMRVQDCFIKCRKLDPILQEMIYHDIEYLYEYTARGDGKKR